MKFNEKLEFGLIILMNVMSFLTTFLILTWVITTPKPKTIVTVDLQQIIKPMIENELKSNKPSRLKKIALKKKMKQLHEQLKLIAAKEHFVILPKEAVIAGSENRTSEIQSLLNLKK